VITKEATLHALILAKNGEMGMNDKNAFLQRLQCTSSFSRFTNAVFDVAGLWLSPKTTTTSVHNNAI